VQDAAEEVWAELGAATACARKVRRPKIVLRIVGTAATACATMVKLPKPVPRTVGAAISQSTRARRAMEMTWAA